MLAILLLGTTGLPALEGELGLLNCKPGFGNFGAENSPQGEVGVLVGTTTVPSGALVMNFGRVFISHPEFAEEDRFNGALLILDSEDKEEAESELFRISSFSSLVI